VTDTFFRQPLSSFKSASRSTSLSSTPSLSRFSSHVIHASRLGKSLGLARRSCKRSFTMVEYLFTPNCRWSISRYGIQSFTVCIGGLLSQKRGANPSMLGEARTPEMVAPTLQRTSHVSHLGKTHTAMCASSLPERSHKQRIVSDLVGRTGTDEGPSVQRRTEHAHSCE